jgi:cytochrome d ubiquinol oxidase subunit II
MSQADAVAAILMAGATLYAIFGGADFGAGAWQLLARLSRRRRELEPRVRARIGHSLGPVWEANHVWLIFVLVVLWTGFPTAFGAVMTTLYVPLALAAVGIVLRGAGFAFGHALERRAAEWSGVVFALSSVITPFFMGTAVGAIASGAVPAGGEGEPFSSWIAPLPLLIGVLFVLSGAYIAAVFLHDDCLRAEDDVLARYFRRRAIAVGVIAGAVALGGLFVLREEAPFVYDGLTGPGLPLLIASAVFGIATLAGLLLGIRWLLRPLAIGAVATVIAGWAVAQHPYLLPETLTIDEGAGAEPALTALIVVFFVALAVVGPALVLLYRLAQKQTLE